MENMTMDDFQKRLIDYEGARWQMLSRVSVCKE